MQALYLLFYLGIYFYLEHLRKVTENSTAVYKTQGICKLLNFVELFQGDKRDNSAAVQELQEQSKDELLEIGILTPSKLNRDGLVIEAEIDSLQEERALLAVYHVHHFKVVDGVEMVARFGK